MPRMQAAAQLCALATLTILPTAGSWAQNSDEGTVDSYRSLKPGAHPYLFFGREDIPRLRRKMMVSPTKELWEATKERCDAFMAQPCEPYPADTYCEQVRSRTERIEGPAFCYVMTGDKQYADRALREIEALLDCPHWIETHVVRNGELRTLDRVTARVALTMAVAYDWLYDELTPQQRERIRRTTVENAIVPIVRAATKGSVGWLTWHRSNWGMGTYGAIGTAVLAFVAEEKEAPHWLSFVVEQVKRGLVEGGPDGGWGEGLQYYAAAWGPPCKFVWALKRVTGGTENLFEHQFLRNLHQFPLYFLMPDRETFVRFGNCNVGPSASTYFLTLLAAEHRDPYAQWMAALGFPRAWGTYRTVYAFIAYDDTVQPKPPTDLPPAKHFRGIDWAVVRTGWDDPNDIFFAFKGGTGDWDHIHGDFNSFTLYAYGARLLVDLGYVRDVWGCRTEAHNTIRVNDEDQYPLTRPAGGARKPEHFCKIGEFVHTEAYDHLIGDATTAYDSKTVKKATREVMFIRPDTFVIFDDVVTASPAVVDWSVHTFGALTVTGNTITVRQDEAAVDIDVVAPSAFSRDIRSKSLQEVGISLPFAGAKADTFIKIRPTERSRRANFLTVLVPRRASAQRRVRTEAVRGQGTLGVRITNGDETALALFNPAGGGMRLGDLATDARSCALIYAGERLRFAAVHEGTNAEHRGQALFSAGPHHADTLLWDDGEVLQSLE
jgi:hypothetical protein